MPQIWNNMVVVTIDELIPTFFPSWKALKLKLWRDSKKAFGIKRAQRGGGLDTKLLIDFDTLPEEWRNQLGDPPQGRLFPGVVFLGGQRSSHILFRDITQ